MTTGDRLRGTPGTAARLAPSRPVSTPLKRSRPAAHARLRPRTGTTPHRQVELRAVSWRHKPGPARRTAPAPRGGLSSVTQPVRPSTRRIMRSESSRNWFSCPLGADEEPSLRSSVANTRTSWANCSNSFIARTMPKDEITGGVAWAGSAAVVLATRRRDPPGFPGVFLLSRPGCRLVLSLGSYS
jgi:hypothetical protein